MRAISTWLQGLDRTRAAVREPQKGSGPGPGEGGRNLVRGVGVLEVAEGSGADHFTHVYIADLLSSAAPAEGTPPHRPSS